ncbi:MAG: DUF362 domain-containing protein [Candidatus Methanoplasma sp.]|jgi:uncharacterized Fe-S center protein|nr:DUF362 domain-containing protein [Candidatus Methanoplasma sp.]
MAASKVYFTDMRTRHGDGLMDKLGRLADAAGIGEMGLERRFVAIKAHFGERGNLAFLRPNYAKAVADRVRGLGGIPFLTDCSTLYVGSRKSGPEHLDTAALNGFNPTSAGCQIIIGDGVKGTDEAEVRVGGEHVETAKIGRAVFDADAIVSLTHFKCHELTGFGGAVKNLGMGCASRRGKMELHATGKPEIDEGECRGCGECEKVCAHSAVKAAGGSARIDGGACAGCGRCIAACPFDAISVAMDEGLDRINRKIAEYALAVVRGKPCLHISVIADVSPFCDCYGDNDLPVIPDVGMLASMDPVALDMACVDLAQRQPMVEGSRLHEKSGGSKPADIFSCIHPGTRWQSLFEHSEKIGLGSPVYELVTVR